MQKNKTNYKQTIILGVILITFGITLMSNNYIKMKREETFNDMNLLLLDSNIDEVNTEENNDNNDNVDSVEEPQEEHKDTSNNYEPYLAVLKIPKVNLERGFYDKGSSLNNVDYNILFHSNSDYPDKLNGNVILASHSGTSSISYFKDLYKLELGDEASINYKNTTYTYKVVNIYKEEKDGTIAIYRNKEKSTLTLITCTKNDNTKQTIYILERI